jgi:hypothetical protein
MIATSFRFNSSWRYPSALAKAQFYPRTRAITQQIPNHSTLSESFIGKESKRSFIPEVEKSRNSSRIVRRSAMASLVKSPWRYIPFLLPFHTRSVFAEEDSDGEEFEVNGGNCSALEYVRNGFRFQDLSCLFVDSCQRIIASRAAFKMGRNFIFVPHPLIFRI